MVCPGLNDLLEDNADLEEACELVIGRDLLGDAHPASPPHAMIMLPLDANGT